MAKWVIEKSESVFRTKIFSINRLLCTHPAKSVTHEFYILHNPDWINVVAIDTAGNFIFVEQHRLGTGTYTLETPAGLIETGEDPVEAAKRELLEETGYEAGKIVLMRKLAANPAIMNNYIYFFLAENCRKICEQQLDIAEDIRVKTFSPQEVQKMLSNGIIDHSIIVTALSLYFMQKEKFLL
ncbi:MAG: NUDIX hydrolase [Spirochaetes bacterium]|nr:NUDIX hydrolase [Spirochaetota bacterium]